MAAPTNAFRTAVEADDHDAIAPPLPEQVTFLSPVAFTPYHSRDGRGDPARRGTRVLGISLRTRDPLAERPGHRPGLSRPRRGREVHGCGFLRLDHAGLIEEFCVLVRPLSAAKALSVAMAEQFEISGREVGHGP